MRILTIGNLYPPHHLGGYELMWRDCVRALRAAGHEVAVLASDHREAAVREPEEPGVARALRSYWVDHRFPALSGREALALERHNARELRSALARTSPDVVSFWSMGGMSLSLIEQVRRAGVPAVAVVGDEWPLYGPAVDRWMRRRWPPAPLRALARRRHGIPTRVDLRALEMLLVSDHLRRRVEEVRGPLRRARVAHQGPDPRFTPAPAPQRWTWSLLYAGRVERRKGVATALRALARLPATARLVICGPAEPGHRGELQRLAGELDLSARICWRDSDRDGLVELYARADAVLFPVEWQEPYGLVPLEAMACGRPVIATGTGGSGEYLRDGVNALLFAPGDERALAAAVQRLAGDPKLRARLRAGGLRTAGKHGPARFHAAVLSLHERAATGP